MARPYHPVCRRMCIGITDRDNTAAHARYLKIIHDMESDYDALMNLLEWATQEHAPVKNYSVYEIRWGDVYDDLIDMSSRPTYISRKWVKTYLDLIEKIVGTSW